MTPPLDFTTLTAPILLSARPENMPVLSTSQVSRFDLCQRWWGWEYLLGIRTPPHPSAQLGTAVHGHLESWLRSATPPPADKKNKAARIAARMIHHLPPPGSGVVERRFFLATPRGFAYTGFIDWSGYVAEPVSPYNAYAISPQESFARSQYGDVQPTVAPTLWMPTIIDHKTTASLQYAKTEADLHNDAQAILYAVVGMIGFGVEEIQLFWNYGTTRDKEAKLLPVKTRITLPVVQKKFSVFEDVAQSIVRLYESRPHPLSLPPTMSACDSFGGCPHRERCNFTEQEKVQVLFMSTDSNNMASRMAGVDPNGGSNGFGPPPGQQGAPQQPFPQQPFPQQPPQQQGEQPQYPPQVPTYAPPAPMPMMPPPGAPQMPPGYGVQGGYPGLPPNGAPQAPFQPPQAFPVPQAPFVPPQAVFAPQPPQAPPGATGPTYDPSVAPNPPEAFQQAPAFARDQPAGQMTHPALAGAPAPGAAPAEGEKAKRTRGRPEGSKNKELSLEASVFMGGVYAAIANPSLTGVSGPNPMILGAAGDVALAVYRAKFGAT